VVVFDKTGTLTLGDPHIVRITLYEGVTQEKLLLLASAAERPSEHPLAKAILKKTENLEIPQVQNWNYTPGRGIMCVCDGLELIVGNSAIMTEKNIDISKYERSSDVQDILVVYNGKLLGCIHIADVLRPSASKAIADLKRMNLRTLLLTGDTNEIAQSIGTALSVDEIIAEKLPEEKMQIMKDLMSNGLKVAMVGDGINDAPALTEANVGIAMGSGTDVARECADVVLLGNDLIKFVEIVKIARQCKWIIYFNFVGTILVDLGGVVLAALGYINPLLAVVIHVTSELFFILNSARLLVGTNLCSYCGNQRQSL